MKKRLPDGEGGWKEKQAFETTVWAAITPLISSKPETPPKSRVEITIRERFDLSEIATIIWGKRGLIPLTQPQALEKHRGYVVFQALCEGSQ